MADFEFRVFGKTEIVSQRIPVVVTIGNFDGVHLGHQHVIKTLREIAHGRPTVAITFDPHPSQVINPQGSKPALTSLSQRVELLLATGVDAVVVQNFSKEFCALTADEFIERYLVANFRLESAVIGFDFCYGSHRSGDWDHLKAAAKRFGFSAHRSTPLIVDGLPVSSSRIRNSIASRDFELAERLLGRPFKMHGVVVKGDQRGRQIGFPTANLGEMESECLVPPYGVYAVEVLLEGETSWRRGVMNCGVRPTIASGLKLQIEAHIFDFSDDVYGKKISFAVKKFIRTEMKFSGLDHLKSQIQSDVTDARVFFGD